VVAAAYAEPDPADCSSDMDAERLVEQLSQQTVHAGYVLDMTLFLLDLINSVIFSYGKTIDIQFGR
jgi:hypothetical protein